MTAYIAARLPIRKPLRSLSPAASRRLALTRGCLRLTGKELMKNSDREFSDAHVGRVIAITPSQAIVLLERQDAAGAANLVVPVEVGTLVKLHRRVSVVYGMITGLRVPLPSPEPSDKDLKLVELDLVGEILDAKGGDGLFRRGVSAYPALD